MINGKIKSLLAAVLCIGVLAGCGDGRVKITEGMQKINEMDYAGAIACFEEAHANHENERLLLRGKGIAYLGLKDYEQAVTSFEESLACGNGLLSDIDFDLNYYLAGAYVGAGQLDRAKSCYDAILELRSKEAEAYFQRGKLCLALKMPQEAVKDFDSAVALDEKNYDRMIAVFDCLSQNGQEELGLRYLQQALERCEKQMSAFDKGRIYYYLKDYQRACLILEEDREQGGVGTFLYLGRAYEATGDYNYATSVYNSYLSKHDGDGTIYNQLGLCELKKENYEGALAAFQSGLTLGEETVQRELLYNEAVTYEYLGDFEKAGELFKNYLLLYPEDTNALREKTFLDGR